MTNNSTESVSAEAYNEVQVHDDLLIPIQGETVAAIRYEPGSSKKELPGLIMYIPYHTHDYQTYGAYNPLIKYLAAGGYQVIVADMVGTGGSSGQKDQAFEGSEAEEGAQLVEWTAEQPWCNGVVGMFGKSYGGITSLKAATQNPDPLEAIVSTHAPHLGFRDYYMGGEFSLYGMGGHWTPLMQALQAKPPGRRDSDGRWASVWRDRLDNLRNDTPWLFDFLEHDTNGPFWEDMDIPAGEIEVPTFAVSGWRDGYPHTTMEYVEQINADTRVLLGPWRHILPQRGRETTIDFRRQVLEWFDYYLKGYDNTAPDQPEIAVWTEKAGGGKVGAGAWQTLDQWPWIDNDPDETISFALTPNGAVLPADHTEHLETEYEIDHTVGIDSEDYGTPIDTNTDDARSLTFETDPLDTPVELTGSGVASLRLSSTIQDTNVTVRVVDISPDGTARMVTFGNLKASHRDGHHDPSPLTPGEEYELNVPLKAKSHVFEAGHKIRFAISGGYFPVTLPNCEHGSFTIVSNPNTASTVTFPGRRYEENEKLSADVEFQPAETHIPLKPETVLDSDELIEVSRDHTENTATVTTAGSKQVDTPQGNLSYREEITAEVAAHDPQTATVSRRTDIEVDYGSEKVTVVATSRAGRNIAEATTRVRIDDEPFFNETWTWNR